LRTFDAGFHGSDRNKKPVWVIKDRRAKVLQARREGKEQEDPGLKKPE
jgi:hypothetical protein